MNAVRTLPIRVAPLPGESIDSWLEAISNRCDTAWEDLLSAVTLRSPDNKCNTWVMRLATAQAAAIGTAAGVAPHLAHAMTLAHYADRAVGIDAATGRFLRAFPWGRAPGFALLPVLPGRHRWALAVDVAPGLGVRLPAASVPAGRYLPDLSWGATP